MATVRRRNSPFSPFSESSDAEILRPPFNRGVVFGGASGGDVFAMLLTISSWSNRHHDQTADRPFIHKLLKDRTMGNIFSSLASLRHKYARRRLAEKILRRLHVSRRRAVRLASFIR